MKVESYTIYITEKQVAENYGKYFHFRHFIADRFLHEHGVKVMDNTKFKYFQNRDNRTGELVMEVEIDATWVDPIADKVMNATRNKV